MRPLTLEELSEGRKDLGATDIGYPTLDTPYRGGIAGALAKRGDGYDLFRIYGDITGRGRFALTDDYWGGPVGLVLDRCNRLIAEFLPDEIPGEKRR